MPTLSYCLRAPNHPLLSDTGAGEWQMCFSFCRWLPVLTTWGREREARRQEEEERTCSCLLAGCSGSNDLASAPHLHSGGGFGFQLLSTLPKCILLPSEGPAAARECPPQLPGLPPPSSLVISSRRSATCLRRLVPALWDALLSFRSDDSHFYRWQGTILPPGLPSQS